MKRKIILISVGVFFLFLCIYFIIINVNKNEIVKGKIINNIEFNDLKIIKENDFQILSFTVQNKNKKDYTLGLVAIHLLSNNNELLIIPITIDSLKSNEKKMIEYIIQEDLYSKIDDFYVTKHVYHEDNDNNNNNIDDSLENKLGNILKVSAKKIIENLEEPIEDSLTLTAYTIENIYQENIDEFKKDEYECSLDNSFVEIVKINNNEYEYISYIDCKILYNK